MNTIDTHPIDTHLCLVSNQPTPNITPVLDQRLAPRSVVLLTSPSMERQANWLSDVMSRRGIKVTRWPVKFAYDIEHLQTRVMELLEDNKEPLSEGSIALNATGGTKPMSIAAYEVFRHDDLPIFYIHPEHDRLVWLHHPGGPQPAIDIEDRIRVEPFLQAHGVSVQHEPARNIPEARLLDVGKEILQSLHTFRNPLGTLNYVASNARNTRKAPISRGQYKQAKQLIRLFEEKGFLQYGNGQIMFPDEASRFFVNGGWFEYLVFDAVRRVRKRHPQIQDIARSVDVVRTHKGKRIRNELDVVFLCNNRLNIIECKTSRFRGKGEDSVGAEVVYKLDALGDLMGGIQARSMLVSYQNISDHHRNRAAGMSIKVCAGDELTKLEDFIEDMVAP